MPATKYVPYKGSWNNLYKVPITALGLARRTYEILTSEGITTVGLLLAHSPDRLGASGVVLGRTAFSDMQEAIKAAGQAAGQRDLKFANDCKGIPTSFIVDKKGSKYKKSGVVNYYGQWSQAQANEFFVSNKLQVLGDVLTLCKNPSRFKKIRLPELSAEQKLYENGEAGYLKSTVHGLKYLLFWYKLLPHPPRLRLYVFRQQMKVPGTKPWLFICNKSRAF